MDWENVAEEIDDLGKSVTWSVESHLETLIEHPLKLAYTREIVRDRNARLWQGTVRLARFKIHRTLTQNPSLRTKLPELFADAYRAGQNQGSNHDEITRGCDSREPALAHREHFRRRFLAICAD